MNQREKLLAGIVLFIAVAYGGYKLWGRYSAALEARRTDLAAARDRLADAELKVAEGTRAAEQLAIWEERSLPANPDRQVTLSLYRARVQQKLIAAGLTPGEVKSSIATGAFTAYTPISLTIENAKGTLAQLTALLHQFYLSSQLQQITKLSIHAPATGSELTITLQVEGLILPRAVQTEKLPEGENQRLNLASLDKYRESIVGRNIFAVYSPPRPATERFVRETPRGPTEVDHAEHAYFTGATGPRDHLQAWITVRTTGKDHYLYPGEPVKIGQLEAEIVAVEPRALVYRSGDKTFRVELGNSLSSGKEIEPEAEAATRPAPSPTDS